MTKSFLEHVARDILLKHGDDLSRIAVVFPNKRAALFLSEHLARLSNRPLWSPAYITISELFRQLSPLQVADPIKLVCDLHHCYTAVTGTDETLDHFYGWGQLLLTDFDDIDKNMADATKVFANLRDLHELDTADYLTPEQKAAIRKFFSNFADDQQTVLKERFLRLWSRITAIYETYNDHLTAQGLAYEGALYRRVVSRLASLTDSFLHQEYIFVGFNLLQKVEQELFAFLKKEGKARFYWDFDKYYMQGGNEAGHFIGQHLALFPNELDNHDDRIYNQFAGAKTITYISAATENIQARYVSAWLTPERISAGRRSAIILGNEALLTSVIHSLPDQVEKVNITTGYPLAQSPVASFVRLLILLQTTGFVPSRNQFRLRQVSAVLRHPYTPFVSTKADGLQKELSKAHIFYPSREILSADEGLKLMFGTPVSGNADLLSWLCQVLQTAARNSRSDDPLLQESIFRAYSLLNRLRTLVADGDLNVDIVTLQRLIGQLVSTTTIPFHGEPAEGLQVMGVLETRNLDFDHLLILSASDSNIPRDVSDSSFIPYSIRKAYGLTTIDHKVSIYSYYFHRLLQRATDITIIYNNATTDGQRGEMSRFMLQLMVEGPHPIRFSTLQAGQHLRPVSHPVIGKTGEVMQRLLDRFADSHNPDAYTRPLFTPTAVNRYMRCPLQFYYNYVCGLKEPDSTDDDSIDNRVFGNIFHEASQKVYTRLTAEGRHEITAADIDLLLKDRIDIERAVDDAIRSELFHSDTMLPLNGLQIINREVIIHYLRLLQQQDRKLAPFSIIGLECDVVAPMTISTGDGSFTTTIGGRIDRLDMVTDSTGMQHIRVIDYKTGNSRPYPLADVNAIFEQQNLSRHSDYYMQTMIYACLVSRSKKYNAQQLPVSPALLFIQHSADDPVLHLGKEPISDVAQHRRQFAQLLKDKADEMFDSSLPFAPTADADRCRTCPYKELCR